jgi:hypothetical protein
MAMGPEFREDQASISAEEQARRRKLVADHRAQSIPSEWIRAAQRYLLDRGIQISPWQRKKPGDAAVPVGCCPHSTSPMWRRV